MKTNYTKHNNKANKYSLKIESIKAKYPEINLSNELRRDINQLFELRNKLIYEEVGAKMCKSENPDDMCEDCKCWKYSRYSCS